MKLTININDDKYSEIIKVLELIDGIEIIKEKKNVVGKRTDTLDNRVKSALNILKDSGHTPSIRKIAKLISKENSLRCIQLSLDRQGIDIKSYKDFDLLPKE